MDAFIGRVFGSWTVLELSHHLKNRQQMYLCQCECGTKKAVYRGNLTSGKTKSCGCKTGDRISSQSKQHGHARTRKSPASPTYSTWSSMLTRCRNSNSKNYPNYGGRGIRVCDRWLDFSNFLADMGEKPEKGMSIERINNDGDYEPANCIWTEAKVQSRNRRNTKLNKNHVKAQRAEEISAEDLIRETGCAKSTVSAAKNRISWKEL